jgi:hypothetical protein
MDQDVRVLTRFQIITVGLALSNETTSTSKGKTNVMKAFLFLNRNLLTH